MKLLFVFLLALFIATPALAQDKDFHAPNTDAEKALDNIFRNYSSTDDMRKFITDKIINDPKSKDISFDKIACTKENKYSSNASYKTLQQSKNASIITYESHQLIANWPLYRMIKSNGNWKLDGILCQDKALSINILNDAKKYCWQTAMTNPAMAECAGLDGEKQWQKLQKIVASINDRYKDQPQRLHAFQAAQAAWEKSVKAQVDWIYNSGEHIATNPMCAEISVETMYKNRIKELELWLNSDQHNVCGGRI